MLILLEHPISPLVFIEVHVVLSFMSPYFLWLSCLLDLDFWWFLLFDCLVSIFVTFVNMCVITLHTSFTVQPIAFSLVKVFNDTLYTQSFPNVVYTDMLRSSSMIVISWHQLTFVLLIPTTRADIPPRQHQWVRAWQTLTDSTRNVMIMWVVTSSVYF